ncbi:MAG: S-layer homology domain-containing protein [bacterium]|nr:S-layer homology domain-containing protein [bacterium]
MKKYSVAIVLAILMLFTVPVMAGPYSDVPFSHWAYDAVKKLTSKGIITGMADGTFQGNKNVSRYELAVTIARAIENIGTSGGKASSADINTLERLTVEFADELALLGVKVTALEDGLQSIRSFDERLAALESGKHGISKGFITGKGGNFSLNGELEFELHDAETGAAAEDDLTFGLDKFVLQPKLKVGDNLSFSTQIYVHESASGSGAYMNEFHAKFSKLDLFSDSSWLDIGLYERYAKGHYGQITEGYSLPGIAFFRDDAYTLTLGGVKAGIFDLKFSIGGGYELDEKVIAESAAPAATKKENEIWHDDVNNAKVWDELEKGINIGAKFGDFDTLFFYYTDELSAADIALLKAGLSGYTSDDNSKDLYGFSTKTTFSGIDCKLMYVEAETGDMEREAYAFEFSKKIKLEGNKRYFTAFTPFIAMSEMDIDDRYDEALASPMSWDRDKTMYGIIFDFTKNTKLKVEYYVNDEDTGGAEVNNDEMLVQLEFKF